MGAPPPRESASGPSTAIGRLTARQVNMALETLVVAAIATGLASWAVGDRWNGWATTAHGVAGLTLVLLAPAKIRGSVRTGFRRARRSRWVSAAFGCLVLATAMLGILHATGLWFGVGYWSALWTHELFGFAVIPLFLWHLLSRRCARVCGTSTAERSSGWAASSVSRSASTPCSVPWRAWSAWPVGPVGAPAPTRWPPMTPSACPR